VWRLRLNQAYTSRQLSPKVQYTYTGWGLRALHICVDLLLSQLKPVLKQLLVA
jgi:hypothetical protein